MRNFLLMVLSFLLFSTHTVDLLCAKKKSSKTIEKKLKQVAPTHNQHTTTAITDLWKIAQTLKFLNSVDLLMQKEHLDNQNKQLKELQRSFNSYLENPFFTTLNNDIKTNAWIKIAINMELLSTYGIILSANGNKAHVKKRR